MLRRARIGLHPQHLLARQRREDWLELRFGEPREVGDGLARERLAEHRPVLEDATFLWAQSVETSGDERVQRLRHLQRLDRGGRPVDGALLHERPAVEEHAHRLDGVQRDALGAVEYLRRQLVRKPRREPAEEIVHG